ncbi:MAG: hypothetical protein ACW98F_04280 [Candidatus Hodarchaeales archaeon]|jgi:hypothetical protein
MTRRGISTIITIIIIFSVLNPIIRDSFRKGVEKDRAEDGIRLKSLKGNEYTLLPDDFIENQNEDSLFNQSSFARPFLGVGNTDRPNKIAADSNNNSLIFGDTHSYTFSIENAQEGSFNLSTQDQPIDTEGVKTIDGWWHASDRAESVNFHWIGLIEGTTFVLYRIPKTGAPSFEQRAVITVPMSAHIPRVSYRPMAGHIFIHYVDQGISTTDGETLFKYAYLTSENDTTFDGWFDLGISLYDGYTFNAGYQVANAPLWRGSGTTDVLFLPINRRRGNGAWIEGRGYIVKWNATSTLTVPNTGGTWTIAYDTGRGNRKGSDMQIQNSPWDNSILGSHTHYTDYYITYIIKSTNNLLNPTAFSPVYISSSTNYMASTFFTAGGVTNEVYAWSREPDKTTNRLQSSDKGTSWVVDTSSSWSTLAVPKYLASTELNVDFIGTDSVTFFLGDGIGGTEVPAFCIWNANNDTFSMYTNISGNAVMPVHAFRQGTTSRFIVTLWNMTDGIWFGYSIIDVDMNVPPIITITSPSNTTYASSSVWLNYTLSETVEWVGYSLDGGTNITLTGNTLLSFLDEGGHSVIIYANDSAGNMGSSATVFWSIKQVPNINLQSFMNNSAWFFGSNIAFSIVDNNLDETWYNWDFNPNQSFIINWNVTLDLSDGWHWITVYANDTDGWLSFKSYHFYCEANSPEIALVDIANDTKVSVGTIIQLNITDFTLDQTWYNWNIGSNQSLSSPWRVTVPSTEGYHNLTIYANDSVGFLTIAQFRWMIRRPPDIVLVSPINNSIQAYGVIISFMFTDTNLDKVWYHWNNEVNQSFSVDWNTTLNLSDGWHWITVYANDSTEEITVYRYRFYCDASPPEIHLSTLLNNSVIAPGTMIRYNISDISPFDAWYRWEGSDNNSLEYPWQITSLEEEGYIYLTVYVEDAVGHTINKKFLFYINYYPSVELSLLANNSVLLPLTEIEFYITDLTLTLVTYSWNEQTNFSISEPFIIPAVTAPGWHSLRINAFDSWGDDWEWVTSLVYRFYILDTTRSSVTENQTIPSTVYVGSSFVYSFTVTNPESINLQLKIVLFGDDDEVKKGNNTVIFLLPGEKKYLEIEIKPKHDSKHQLILNLYHFDIRYYEKVLNFNVEPQWMNPNVLFPIAFFSIAIVLIGVSVYFLAGQFRIYQLYWELNAQLQDLITQILIANMELSIDQEKGSEETSSSRIPGIMSYSLLSEPIDRQALESQFLSLRDQILNSKLSKIQELSKLLTQAEELLNEAAESD